MDKVRDAASQHYAELPYHNFKHAKDVAARAEDLIDRCRRHGHDVEADVVRAAAYFHDAGYQDDPEAHGYATKEEHSAAIADRELDELGYGDAFRRKVRDCIIATEQRQDTPSIEAKILRAADLAGLAGDYDQFLESARKLRQEAEALHGEQPDRKTWKEQVRKTVEFYLGQDIRLTPEHDQDGESVFHRKARENLERFLEEH